MKAIDELKEIDQWVAWDAEKKPVSPRGMSASSTDAGTWGTCSEAKFIRRMQRLPGVGFVLTESDPYVCIDLDKAISKDGEVADWAIEICDRFRSYTEYSPSERGLHIWMRGELPRSGARNDEIGVEVYQSRRYMTVTGLPFEGYPSTIQDRSEELLPWFAETFGRVEPADEHDTDWECASTIEWIEDALSCIDSDCSYQDWIKVGTALKTEFGPDEGLTYWDAWSMDGVKYPGWDELQRQWASLKPGAVQIASIVFLAKPGGFDLSYYADLEAPEGFEPHVFDQIFERMGSVEDQQLDTGIGIVFHDFADIYLDKTEVEPDLVAPGVFGKGDFVLVFGPPKAMKSMMVLDWCTRLALGENWLGLETLRPLNVAILQFENKYDQLRSRLQMQNLSRDELERIKGRLQITNRFTPRLTAAFVEECAEQALKSFDAPIDLLVIDPLANLFSGDNENDNAQMMKFLAGLKILRNRLNPDAAILLVHHAGKMARKERQVEPFNSFRGASSLRGSYDTGICLDLLASGERKIWFELRNGPPVEAQKLTFEAGRFFPSEDQDDDECSGSGSQGGGLERILELINLQGNGGLYYVAKAFVMNFAEEIGMSASSIHNEIKRLAMDGEIRYHSGEGLDDYPIVHHRSSGYMLTRDLLLLPNRKMDPRTGSVTACEGWT